jgi:hypothetical protein
MLHLLSSAAAPAHSFTQEVTVRCSSSTSYVAASMRMPPLLLLLLLLLLTFAAAAAAHLCCCCCSPPAARSVRSARPCWDLMLRCGQCAASAAAAMQ